MRLLLSTSFILILHTVLLGQFNADAGLIKPFSQNAIITVSSGKHANYITDRNKNSFWESENPLPVNYIKRNDLNIFFSKVGFSSSQNTGYATDGDLNTKITIQPSSLIFHFKKPQYLYFLSIKYQSEKPLSLVILYNDNTSKTVQLIPDNNFRVQKITLEKEVSFITLKSTTSYNLFEIAALRQLPTEYVLFDFKKPVPVGQLYIRALNDAQTSGIEVLGGNDANNLTHLFSIRPTAIPLIPYIIEPEKKIRYLKILFHLPRVNYYKVKLWEADIYNRYGPYGAPEKAVRSKQTYGQSFGVNAFWGWGYNVYPDQIPKDKGPFAFNKICTLARNYHRLDWDINSPAQIPDYKNMNHRGGTLVTPWLNWDREYGGWKNAGFNIDISLLFNNNLFPDTLWKKPYNESFNLGKRFVSHFVKNKSFTNQIEVGNEPWSYKPHIYQQILSGFADGAQQISRVTLLPCAIQAYNPHPETNNYIKAYLNKNLTNKVAGLNTHIYNYIFDTTGARIAINPEDRRAKTWSINNLNRYRDANMPGKNIYVTEFGYDSRGGGEKCTHSVCVSEKVQAIYGVRMALMLQRLGVKQFYWYYFANDASASYLHNRAGLTASSKNGFRKKTAFYAFQRLYKNLKDFHFEKVITESNRLYAYLFADHKNNLMIVAWIPTHANHDKHRWVTVPGNYTFQLATPIISDNEIKIDRNRLFISGIPVLLKASTF